MITTENILFLLLQAFSSGVAGYITNKYAVNMIFKEYTPLKIGGAVKKNKEKFIDEISDLVERDIINSSTLKNSILDEKFKEVISDTGKDLFEKSLYEIMKDKTIESIPGFNETISNVEVLLRENLKDIIPDIINNISEHLKLEDLLNDNQVSKMVDYIYDEVMGEINYNEEFIYLASDLYNEQSDICLNQFVSKETSEKLTRIISCEIIKAIDETLDSKKEIKSLVDKVLSLVDIKSVLKNIEKNMGSKSIQEILNEEDIEKLSSLIYDNMDELVKSEEGRNKIKSIVEEIFEASKRIDLTLFEILPIHFGRISSEYIAQLIEKFIPYISAWIEDNKESIEKIIDDSIFETIDNIDDELRKSMISKVNDSMLNDFSSRNEIVNKITDFINNYKINEESSYNLYSRIVKFLEETKIKDLVIILETNNLINEENTTDIIINKWEDSGRELSKVLLRRQFSKTINKLIDQDLNKLFNKNIKPKIYESILINKDKIISHLDKIIFDMVHNKIDSILNKKINELFNESQVERFSTILPNKIYRFLDRKRKNYKNNLRNNLNNYIRSIKIEDLVSEYEENLSSSLIDKTIEAGVGYIDKYKYYEMSTILDKVNENKDISRNFTDKIYSSTVENIPYIVDGRIKKVIYENLIKLDEEEICNIAQSFMGKQLKPLSVFGAFLGIIVGIIFGITMQNINGSYGFYNNLHNTLIGCAIMAGIGVTTNIIALWMVFCPYEKNKFISKIPVFRIFSIGYIPAHKDKFASGMAHFIEDDLLSGDRMVDLFSSNKKKYKSDIISNIINSNYKIILNFMNSKKKNISDITYKFILKLCRKNRDVITKLACDNVLNIKCNKFISENFINKRTTELLNNLNKFEDKIANYCEEKLKINKSMGEILPDELIKLINEKIDNDIKSYFHNKIETDIIDNLVKNIIFKNEKVYDNLMNKSIKDIISEKSLLSIKNNVKTDKFINIILLELKEGLNNNLQQYLSNEFNEDKRFDELFDGKIKNKLDKEIYNLTEKATDKLLTFIKNNNDEIASMVIKIVRRNLNFFVKMAYDFADGDTLVKDVVNNVVETKIDTLIKEDKDKISVMLYSFLEKEIYSNKIKNLGVKPKEINMSLLLDRLVFELKKGKELKKYIYDSSDLTINKISEIRINDIAIILNMENINKLYDKCKDILNLAAHDIVINVKENEVDVNEFVLQLINDKLMKYFYSISLVEMSWELNGEDIRFTLNNLLSVVETSDVINKYVSILCNDLYKSSIKDVEMSTILDNNQLIECVNDKLGNLFNDKDFNKKYKLIIEKILDIIIEDDLRFVSDELKEALLNTVLKAALNSIEKNIIPLLRALNLKKITIEEVEKMHPSEIHILFKSFAGDFFIKLYIYGAFGFIFGVNVYLSIILALIDIAYTKKIEKTVATSQGNLFKQ